jgi:hypothetical protein
MSFSTLALGQISLPAGIFLDRSHDHIFVLPD